LVNWLKRYPWLPLGVLIAAIVLAVILFVLLGPAAGTVAILVAIGVGISLYRLLRKWRTAVQAGSTISQSGQTPDSVSLYPASSNFVFLQPYRGCEVIARRNTLIALDGDTEIRTPHDDCLLIMPSLRPSRGHTAVRLARFVAVERAA